MTNKEKLIEEAVEEFQQTFFIRTEEGYIPNPSLDTLAFAKNFLRQKLTQAKAQERERIRGWAEKRMMNPPPYPIEDENNPRLQAMQDGARMGDTTALQDLLNELK